MTAQETMSDVLETCNSDILIPNAFMRQAASRHLTRCRLSHKGIRDKDDRARNHVRSTSFYEWR